MGADFLLGDFGVSGGNGVVFGQLGDLAIRVSEHDLVRFIARGGSGAVGISGDGFGVPYCFSWEREPVGPGTLRRAVKFVLQFADSCRHIIEFMILPR